MVQAFWIWGTVMGVPGKPPGQKAVNGYGFCLAFCGGGHTLLVIRLIVSLAGQKAVNGYADATAGGQDMPTMAIRQVTKEVATCPKCRQQSACDYVESKEPVGSIPMWVVCVVGICTGGLGFIMWPWRKRLETGYKLSCPKCGHIFVTK